MQKINLNENEASQLYGPSVHWFRRARWKGDGPRYIKLAGSVLYPVTELKAFFESHLVKSTSEASQRNLVLAVKREKMSKRNSSI